MTPERREELRLVERDRFNTKFDHYDLCRVCGNRYPKGANAHLCQITAEEARDLIAHIDALTAERDAEKERADGNFASYERIRATLSDKHNRVCELEAALKPFAHLASYYDAGEPNWLPDACPVRANPEMHQIDEKCPTVGSLRVARAALENKQN